MKLKSYNINYEFFFSIKQITIFKNCKNLLGVAWHLFIFNKNGEFVSAVEQQVVMRPLAMHGEQHW